MNETESIDQTIGQVERLYRSITGREVPPIREQAYAVIPPEKVPEEHVQEQVDRLVEVLTEFSGHAPYDGWRPPVSTWESRNEILVSMDLPGVPRDQVQVSVSGGMLQVHGSRPPRTSQDGGQLELRYSEPRFGKFQRVLPLPPGMALDQLQAQMRAGVLEIRIPRATVSQDVRTVHVG
jgi:HSP20 family protein